MQLVVQDHDPRRSLGDNQAGSRGKKMRKEEAAYQQSTLEDLMGVEPKHTILSFRSDSTLDNNRDLTRRRKSGERKDDVDELLRKKQRRQEAIHPKSSVLDPVIYRQFLERQKRYAKRVAPRRPNTRSAGKVETVTLDEKRGCVRL